MIFNRPRRQKKENSLTWVINYAPNIPQSQVTFSVQFSCASLYNGAECFRIAMGYYSSLKAYAIIYALRVIGGENVYYSDSRGWVKDGYRTITFDEEPTGDLLTWLEANATPQ